MDEQMPDGANLRETRLDRAALIMTIKCGLPGTGMPPFDKFAHSDGRCYGLKQADLAKAGQRMSDPPATLQNREIDFIADFMFAMVIGKGPMDHAAMNFSMKGSKSCAFIRPGAHVGDALPQGRGRHRRHERPTCGRGRGQRVGPALHRRDAACRGIFVRRPRMGG
jgi:hypothetical protein